ncbi:STT3 domain-containing protein [Desulfocurvus sp. DL9XJH121]
MNRLGRLDSLRPPQDAEALRPGERWWREALAWGAAVMVLGFALRCPEMGRLFDPANMVVGEPLLATHDAYAYLAGAKGVSRYIMDPLTRLLAAAHAVTGIGLLSLGFWLPPLLSGLAALPLCLLCARLGRNEAGGLAGLLAVGAFGYLIRTRFGYFDNDFLTLFFAVGTVSALVLWLLPQCRSWWLPGEEDDVQGPAMHVLMGWAFGVGLFLHAYVWVYPSGRPVAFSVLVLALGLGLALARPGRRTGMLLGLCVILAVLQLGWPGLAAGAALYAVLRWRPELGRGRAATLAAVGGLAVLGALTLAPQLKQVAYYLTVYFNPTGAEQDQGAGGGLGLPSVISSVREAGKLGTAKLFGYVGGHPALFVLGAAAYLWAVVRRPLLVLFAPVLGLGLAAPWLGVRFSMYGGAALGLGLGLAAADLGRARLSGRNARLGLQGALTAVLFGILFLPASHLSARPAVPRALAEAYIELRDLAAPDAVLWQWWDYSYGAQFFAERDTFGDGARHSGDWLYPLALVHSSSSPLRSARVMQALGASWREQAEKWKAESAGYPGARLEMPSVDPLGPVRAMDGDEATRFFKDLGQMDAESFGPRPEQYLALSWDSMHFLGWINYYGSWDLATGDGVRSASSLVPGGSIDFVQGRALRPDGKSVALGGLYYIDKQLRVRHRSWMRFGVPYCVANAARGEMYLMDGDIYRSMMVSMLLGSPSAFEPYFTLVVDKGPEARIYRVN